jgi:hypothetical protein
MGIIDWFYAGFLIAAIIIGIILLIKVIKLAIEIW